MSELSKRERVELALAGEPVDRVPVAAWQHFIPAERKPDTLAVTSLHYFRTYDWDWLKVNPRATYYAEAWGNRYDFDRYTGVLPAFVDGPLQTPADLPKIGHVNPTGGVFGEQIELVRLIKAGIGDGAGTGAHFLQTVFSPLSVLAFLTSRPVAGQSLDEIQEAQNASLKRYLQENPKGAQEALGNIAATLSQYAAASVDAGASGIFFAIVKLARQGVLSEKEYEEFGRPYDLQVLRAVHGAPFNLLHICGPAVYFDAVTTYPVHAINWAAVGQQNPTVREARGITHQALVGGVDENGVLQTGAPDDVRREAQEAIRATGGRRLLLTPGCGTSTDVRAENLRALREAVELSHVSG